MIKYDILIPAYNAEKTLAELLEEIKGLPDLPSHLIIVDDGSTDKTAEIALQFTDHLLQNKEREGKGFALRQGFDQFLTHSAADYLICLDADLQHPPQSILEFLKKAEHNSSSILIGKRGRKVREMPLLRILSNTITSLVLSLLTGQKIEDSQCGFRMIKREVLTELKLCENGFQLESEFILKASRKGYRLEFVDIPTIYGNHPSNIDHLGDTLRFIKLVWNYLVHQL